ncbi:spore germination protein [Brevibacillus formosus]|uniref:Spore germination protein n=1 Tax=Brevibacillus formosus TaxID=54913 RepID=A0A220MP08_9BACL|nr:spore germination protein [Brevibacillus formosus]ASJ56847.1 spore germination protein [Brevibacillus formosus]
MESIAPFTDDYLSNLNLIRQEIGQNADVHIREFSFGQTAIRASIIFVDGLSDLDLIDNTIMKSLMSDSLAAMVKEHSSGDVSVSKELLINHVLSIHEILECRDVYDLRTKVLTGFTALLIEGSAIAFLLNTVKAKTRNIDEPVSESLVRGPRVGFTETLSENTALLRRHGENGDLLFLKFMVGERAKKELIIAFMKEIANPALVEEVKNRITKIKIDHVPESGYVEQFIEENYLSPFPQVQSTERPDRVISALMEGRVAILLDGTPFALIVPVTFSMLLQSPEDYYERWIPSTFIRLLRFFTAFASLLIPALYISFLSFHQGLIPTELAISIIGTRQGVPFPSLLEALIMEVSIEIMREAGLRLPKPIGPAIGIVGGLIIGQAAVQAGIVSPIMVIVVAVTAISSFAIPSYNLGISLRLIRFLVMFSAAMFGLYGVVLFFLLLTSHLVKLKSFGVPYVTPAVPYRLRDWKDFMVRMPLMMMKRRPKMLNTKDPIRKG